MQQNTVREARVTEFLQLGLISSNKVLGSRILEIDCKIPLLSFRSKFIKVGSVLCFNLLFPIKGLRASFPGGTDTEISVSDILSVML